MVLGGFLSKIKQDGIRETYAMLSQYKKFYLFMEDIYAKGHFKTNEYSLQQMQTINCKRTIEGIVRFSDKQREYVTISDYYLKTVAEEDIDEMFGIFLDFCKFVYGESVLKRGLEDEVFGDLFRINAITHKFTKEDKLTYLFNATYYVILSAFFEGVKVGDRGIKDDIYDTLNAYASKNIFPKVNNFVNDVFDSVPGFVENDEEGHAKGEYAKLHRLVKFQYKQGVYDSNTRKRYIDMIFNTTKDTAEIAYKLFVFNPGSTTKEDRREVLCNIVIAGDIYRIRKQMSKYSKMAFVLEAINVFP